MKNRMQWAIRAGKPNKAVRLDGTHVEMLQVDVNVCEELLTTWWSTIGCTGIFPRQWTEGVISPLYKKGKQ